MNDFTEQIDDLAENLDSDTETTNNEVVIRSRNTGDNFRDDLVAYINSWGQDIEVLIEKNVGLRFVETPRKLDIILKYNNRGENKYLGIEAKVQTTSGTAYQKLSYALDDCLACPIPTIMVFAGNGINNDMKSKLILSGIGIEVGYDPETYVITDRYKIFQQRVYIELGLDWFDLF